MKRTIFALTISMLVATAPMVSAQHKGGSKPTTPHGSPAPTTHATSPHTSGSTKTTSAGSLKTAKTPKTTKTQKASKTASPTGTTPTSTTTLSPVQQKLQRNTNLATKLQSRLPAGTNLTTAAAGFRNLGQFVAAVNVSNNLGIPFADLKTRMVDRHMSLGQAIQDARPATSGTTVVARHAETEADDMIRTTATTASPSTKTAKPVKSAKTHKGTDGSK
jgi:hypothetical protein